MSDLIDPRHNETRTLLRSLGVFLVIVGLVFTLIGMVSFFSAFGGGGPPRYFWCAFIGLPLLGVGMSISQFAFIGSIARFTAGEVAPVGEDATNYMVAGTKDSIRDVATAIGEGLAAAGTAEAARRTKCQKCGTQNDAAANFCDHCGAPLAKSAICPKCGTPHDLDARFCDHCGAAVG